MTDDLRAKIDELRRLDADRRTYPHVGITGAMRLEQALQIGRFFANEAERLMEENERLRAALRPFAEFYAQKRSAPTVEECQRAVELLEGKP